jgi:hypothetical protein
MWNKSFHWNWTARDQTLPHSTWNRPCSWAGVRSWLMRDHKMISEYFWKKRIRKCEKHRIKAVQWEKKEKHLLHRMWNGLWTWAKVRPWLKNLHKPISEYILNKVSKNVKRKNVKNVDLKHCKRVKFTIQKISNLNSGQVLTQALSQTHLWIYILNKRFGKVKIMNLKHYKEPKLTIQNLEWCKLGLSNFP